MLNILISADKQPLVILFCEPGENMRTEGLELTKLMCILEDGKKIKL